MKHRIKVAILSSASGGGAGIAAKRICDALNLGADYQSDFIDIASLREAVPSSVAKSGSLSNRRYTDTHFTAEYPGFVRGWLLALLSKYDIVNVHWASFLITTSELIALARTRTKILITMHDFYYSTGGCHYQAGCAGQFFSCIACPQADTRSFSYADILAAYREKVELLSFSNVHISAPSKYLVDTVVATGIVDPERAHVIRNIYHADGEAFGDKQAVKTNILLVADSLVERRKGMRLALAALADATARYDGRLNVHIVGHADDELQRICAEHRLRAVFHGKIGDHAELVKLYRSVGILLTCSYEDNWPNVLVEGGAYGVVPVVGSGHGCEEFCRVFGIGQVISRYTPEAFSEGIVRCVAEYPDNGALVAYSSAVRQCHEAADVIATYEQVIAQIASDGTSARAVPRTAKVPVAVSENYRSLVRARGGIADAKHEKAGPFSQSSHDFAGYGIVSYACRSSFHQGAGS